MIKNCVISITIVLIVIKLTYGISNLCPFVPNVKCQCLEQEEETLSGFKITGFKVECSNTTGNTLHTDVDRIYTNYRTRNRTIYSLQVRDSNLKDLYGLPPGLVDLRHLTLDNTGIDLEQIRESSEILIGLRSLRVFRETFTEIPENFFTDLHGLNILGLNDVGIAAISEDGFRYLEDSLKELSLRENKLRNIPIAVASLAYLETIDLTDNDITTVSDDSTRHLEYGLKSLNKLIMNREFFSPSNQIIRSLESKQV